MKLFDSIKSGLGIEPHELPSFIESVRFVSLLFLSIVSFCIIAEMSKRQQLLHRLSERIDEVNRNLAVARGDSVRNGASEEGLRAELAALEILRWQGRALIDRGAHGESRFALRALQAREFESLHLAGTVDQLRGDTTLDAETRARLDRFVSSFRSTADVAPAGAGEQPPAPTLLGVNLGFLWQVNGGRAEWIGILPRFSSDTLAALLILLCAGIGSVAVGLRADVPTSWEDLARGTVSGIAVFFLVKGGQGVFTFEAGAAQGAAFNPYSIALTGLIAGLFTERVFEILAQRATPAKNAGAPQPDGAGQPAPAAGGQPGQAVGGRPPAQGHAGQPAAPANPGRPAGQAGSGRQAAKEDTGARPVQEDLENEVAVG